jgi:hypothetical protein
MPWRWKKEAAWSGGFYEGAGIFFYFYLPVYFYCSGFRVGLLLWVCSKINIAGIVPVRRHGPPGLTECSQTGKKCDAVHKKTGNCADRRSTGMDRRAGLMGRL